MPKSATISIAKGKGSLAHTDRTNSRSNSIDPSQSDRNIVIVNRSLEDVYHELFDTALAKHNQKQIEKGHEERVINDYLEKIERSKQEKPFYELIFEVGNTLDFERGSIDDLAFQKILTDYAQDFENRNPNFKVVKSIIHNDEPNSLAHLHIDFVPFSTSNKRGLETKTSLSGAFAQMGLTRNGFADWRDRELEHLKQCLVEHDYEFKKGDGRTTHFNVPEFKKYTEEKMQLENEIQKIEQKHDKLLSIEIQPKKQLKAVEADKSLLGKETVPYETYLNAVKYANSLLADNSTLKSQNNVLETQKRGLEEDLDQIKASTSYQELKVLRDENTTLKKRNNDLNKFSDRLNARFEKFKSVVEEALFMFEMRFNIDLDWIRDFMDIKNQLNEIQEKKELLNYSFLTWSQLPDAKKEVELHDKLRTLTGEKKTIDIEYEQSQEYELE